MSREASRTVSRRNLFRALLGRDIPAGHTQHGPEPDRHAAGDAAYAAGNFPAAVAAYRASVRGDLSNPTARARLGCALYATGQHIQARVEFEHVLRLEGADLPLARLGLGLTLLALDKADRAAAVLAAFDDPSRPELTAAAREAASRLTAGGADDPAALRIALERTAQATALLPDFPKA